MSGIYKIVNKINGKFYIGSSKNLYKRRLTHLRDLRKGVHHNIFLQRSFNKYSECAFKFYIIEYTEDLFTREVYWIDKLKPDFNIGGVCGGDNYTNHPNKEEIRKRLIKILKANPHRVTKYGKDNPNWRGGWKYHCKCGKEMASTAKTCSKCRDRSGGNNPFSGKSHSIETLDKIREANRGHTHLYEKISANGIIYESKKDCALALGISRSLITYRLKKYPLEYFNVS